MKKRVSILFFIISFISIVNAGSISISPAYYTNHFEKNFQDEYEFKVFSSSIEGGIGITLEGDLTNYANLSTNFISGSGSFTVKLKLPESLDTPGPHELYVKVFESKNGTNITSVGGIAAVRAPITIMVPYPGKYAESQFSIKDINEGEDTNYELEIQNLGTDDLTINTKVEIFKINSTEAIITKTLNNLLLESKNSFLVQDTLDTNKFEPGEYIAKATINYGEEKILNTTFKVGEFLIDIIDYSYLFEQGKINKFDILIENKWNTPIESIYGEVTITDNGKVISSFRTVSIDANPWEVKNITGFFDAEGLEPKRYLANIKIHYEDSSTNKLVAVYVQEPPKEKNYLIIILFIVVSISLAIVITLIFLLLKIKKLKKKVHEK